MGSDQRPSLGPPFEAYLTTARNGGPRTRLDGERIVVVLGRDKEGRPLEVSIYLVERDQIPRGDA